MKTSRSIPVLAAAAVMTALLAPGCGEGIVKYNGEGYSPKIVIEGYIYPGQPVQDIGISRNFPFNRDLANSLLFIPDADAAIIDESGRRYQLRYDSQRQGYGYPGADLAIEPGKSYTLDVRATFDGHDLSAQATTHVPEAGFQILPDESVLGSMAYRERNAQGELKSFEIGFQRSPNTTFYAVRIYSEDADTSTFVWDNPFFDFELDDLLDDFEDLRNRWSWTQDTPEVAGISHTEIFWFDLWFYGEYELVLYAGDRNFKDFTTTHRDVKEIDGNFHEPVLHIDGDGIGVFGSALADTVRIEVLRPPSS